MSVPHTKRHENSTIFRRDIEVFRADNHEVENAHWFGDCFISLLKVGLYFVMAGVAVLILDVFGVPILE
jgi:hypothetical protein